MKYLLLDGKNVDVGGCRDCPLCDSEYNDATATWDLFCKYPGVNVSELIEEGWTEDHYMSGCPLSPYQSLHHLYVSAKCIYQTVKTLYDNFRKWWDGKK